MTELCYYSDGYKKEIDVELVEIRGNALVFDRTIFYPEAGGQPGDRGFWGSVPILDTQKDKKDGTPLHIVNDSSKFHIGDRATLTLDWEHRYKYMKEHSCQHLISALFFKEEEIGTVAVHQGEEILTIETDVKDISQEVLLSIEDKANESVRKGLRIYQKEMSHIEAENLHMRRTIKVDGDVKVVFIDTLDAVACGGVHVANTSEIGEIVYRGKESIRGHVRTMWSCSDVAVGYRRTNNEIINASSKLLSAERDNIPLEIERIQNEVFELKREVLVLRKQLAEKEFSQHLVTYKGKCVIFTTTLSPEDFQEIAIASGKEVFILQEG